ncbi:hypothetical protein sos41_28950 [Alphaproteobacteria bacterium SO-S41]|nr:hypothetical protein sos41_28950 [Alphaproteobacteria bacterium SO-S41]
MDQTHALARALTRPKSDILICFSHLRWDFVFQRPQHLMTRFAKTLPVIYFEEPVGAAGDEASLSLKQADSADIWIATPHLPASLDVEARLAAQRGMLATLLDDFGASNPLLWFYTPMMFPLACDLAPAGTVYDCMDELSNFKFAPADLADRERDLMAAADVVFTGGTSLFEAKQGRHPNVHAFSSGVDVAHFAQARAEMQQPDDQSAIPHPRLGFYGVVDERMDLVLLGAVAAQRPDWSFVIVGPVVKIDPATLPTASNIHYLGGKTYDELPAYLSGWNVALMPFAQNDATRFISPTKTPEYLAGGKPVVSTPVRDVVRHYGTLGSVLIADTADTFVAACDRALSGIMADPAIAAATIDALTGASWDGVHAGMEQILAKALANPRAPSQPRARRKADYDVLVVGAGFAGSVMAERLAADGGKRVLVIDRRPHIGGNAYDRLNDDGILVHPYGPHIFHTNSAEIQTYLSRFTAWRPYEHRVLGHVRDQLVPIPINRQTLNQVFNLSLTTDAEAEAFLKSRAEPTGEIRSSEDVVVSVVGRELYEMFFRGYTRKQWGLDPSQLNKSVTARVPTRTSLDDRYFTDTFQAMPAEGYTRMFEAMLSHPNITVETSVDYDAVKHRFTPDLTVYTGTVDAYFGYRYGRLPYRSLRFEHETHAAEQYQPVGTVNYPDESVPFTRISEFKHLTGQTHAKTSIVREYPSAEGDPYYPIPTEENDALYRRYAELAARESGVKFVGRLATYRYYNMDQIVGQALATYRRLQTRTPADAVAYADIAVAAR